MKLSKAAHRLSEKERRWSARATILLFSSRHYCVERLPNPVLELTGVNGFLVDLDHVERHLARCSSHLCLKSRADAGVCSSFDALPLARMQCGKTACVMRFAC
jgi:hypothetical protein